MKQNETTRKLPKKEERMLTYCAEGGAPLYVVTRHIITGVFRLYKVAAGGYKFKKSRANDPLFPEVCK